MNGERFLESPGRPIKYSRHKIFLVVDNWVPALQAGQETSA
ncbi:MAG: hypothetical protein NT080_01300 [Spirochaetes bacterium]|nr:hypothetical protein [Spirochaetota bacterium]